MALALLPGCGNYERQVTDNSDYYAFTPRAGDDIVQTPVPPPIAPVSDPLDSTPNPLVSDQNNMDDTSDFATDAGNEEGHSADDYLLYWINGDIQGGSVAIAINGISLGSSSGHVDKQLSRFCHDGINTLTFTHYPASGSHCTVDLKVYDGNLPKGSPPIMVYDTAQDPQASSAAQDALQAPSNPAFPTTAGPNQAAPLTPGQAPDPSSLGGSAGGLTTQPAGLASQPATVTTETRTFRGRPYKEIKASLGLR